MTDLLPPASTDFKVWYSVAIIDTAGYVLFFVIAVCSLRTLWRVRARATTVGRRALLPYTAVLLVLGVAIYALEMSAIVVAVRLTAAGHDFTGLVPGVPISTEIGINVLGQVAALLNDALLTYRAYAIATHKIRVIIVPAILWTTALILVLIENVSVLSLPPGVPPPAFLRSILLAWLGTIMALNVTLTSTIIAILWPARRVAGSVIGIVAESAAAYTVVTILYTATAAINVPYGTIFLQLFGIGAFLSSTVITFRIARGIAYVQKDTCTEISLLPTTSCSSSRREAAEKSDTASPISPRLTTWSDPPRLTT